jgi:uncharacterized protein (TIGR02391 family)
MPRKPIPQPQEAPVMLTVPHDEAVRRIDERIGKGAELRDGLLRVPDDLKQKEQEFWTWSEYNEELLLQMFTSRKMAEEYSSSIGVVFAGDRTFAEEVQELSEDIDKKIRRLQSLKDRVELIPLAPGVAAGSPPHHEPHQDWIWRLMHDSVRAAARDRFDHAHYADAVEAAFKMLNNEVKKIARSRGGPEMDGATLMHTAFSPKNPLIVLADLSTQSGRDMQQGYMELFAGSMSAIRNPKAHDDVTITQERALHLLFLASTLWSTLEARL